MNNKVVKRFSFKFCFSHTFFNFYIIHILFLFFIFLFLLHMFLFLLSPFYFLLFYWFFILLYILFLSFLFFLILFFLIFFNLIFSYFISFDHFRFCVFVNIVLKKFIKMKKRGWKFEVNFGCSTSVPSLLTFPLSCKDFFWSSHVTLLLRFRHSKGNRGQVYHGCTNDRHGSGQQT